MGLNFKRTPLYYIVCLHETSGFSEKAWSVNVRHSKAKRGVGVTGPLVSPLPFPSCETFTSLLTFQAASFLTCEMGERMFIQTNSVLSVN